MNRDKDTVEVPDGWGRDDDPETVDDSIGANVEQDPADIGEPPPAEDGGGQ